MRFLIKQAQIIDKNSTFNQQIKDIYVEDGIIIEIADFIEK